MKNKIEDIKYKNVIENDPNEYWKYLIAGVIQFIANTYIEKQYELEKASS